MVFAVYISFAVYGCTVIGDGMEMRKMVRYDSYSLNFFNFVDKYFSSFGYRPMIMFTGNITYSDPSTEAAILDFIEKVESLPSIGDPLYTDCWVRQWSRFMAKNGKYQGLNNSNEETYIRNLKENFLGGETHSFRTDIVFNEDNTRIVASRCIVQAVNVMNAVRDRRLLEDLRQLADESPFNVTIFNSMFIFFDHLSMVRSTSLATVGLSAAVMVVIALIFIPNAICALWVGLAIVSIETGVVGYMGLWGVNFDVLSMIQLIMCVGFSVDFTAHISYAYLAAKADTPEGL
ncbi:hypothetical protein HAZT_HAZT000998 [Hyalella azteca]|uniref:SSD domain-containing protein n=1 Tax=Hyalella azteca TaxID=294128 RepID=A0A6A0GVN6_HYAAZ|nr:hypothetical protein HAZT_HAZT000998 [Hyalella azteca]